MGRSSRRRGRSDDRDEDEWERERSRDREWERSRDRESGRDGKDDGKRHNLSIPICKDFTRGRCSRSIMECRYAHPPPTVTVEGELVTICYDSLRDRCARGLSCRYFHPPPHIRVLMQEAVGIEPAPLGFALDQVRPSNVILGPPRLPPPPSALVIPPPVKTITRPSIEVCRDYARGRCKRDAEECRFAHHTPTGGDGDHVIVCQDFMRGKCERQACRYFHPPEHLRSRVKDLPAGPANVTNPPRFETSSLDVYNAYAASLYEHQAKRMRVEEPLGDRRQKGSSGPVFSGGQSVYSTILRPPSPARNDQDKLPVCRDFLRNKCTRNTTCRFVHPEPHAQVVDGYVTLCRDSLRGKCKREQCRFYHPPSKSDPHTNIGNGDVDTEEYGNHADTMANSSSLSPNANGRSPYQGTTSAPYFSQFCILYAALVSTKDGHRNLHSFPAHLQ